MTGDAPFAVEGLGKRVGSGVRPPRDVFADLGGRDAGGDLAARARARRDEVRSAFNEGHVFGERWFDRSAAWEMSDTLRALQGGLLGFNIVGQGVVCSDPRAAGRDAWRVLGVYDERAWLHSEGVDLVVGLSTLRHLVTLEGFTTARR